MEGALDAQTLAIVAAAAVWGFKGALDLVDRFRPTSRNGRAVTDATVEAAAAATARNALYTQGIAGAAALAEIKQGMDRIESSQNTGNTSLKEAVLGMTVMMTRLQQQGELLQAMSVREQQRDQLGGQVKQVLEQMQRRVELCPVQKG